MAKLALTCVIKKERSIYSSICPELDVASQGNTPEEARKNLVEAVEGFLTVAKEEGMLDEILERASIKKRKRAIVELISVPLPA